MSNDFALRRKWTVKAHGRQIVLVKRPAEKSEHVVMKALLWALYLPDYPDLGVELSIGDRYKPDVVALDASGRPRFWGEAGQVGRDKIQSIARRFPTTHLVIGKWNTRLEPFADLVRQAVRGTRHAAPLDLIGFPADSAERFIDADGQIHIAHAGLEWLRLGSTAG